MGDYEDFYEPEDRKSDRTIKHREGQKKHLKSSSGQSQTKCSFHGSWRSDSNAICFHWITNRAIEQLGRGGTDNLLEAAAKKRVKHTA